MPSTDSWRRRLLTWLAHAAIVLAILGGLDWTGAVVGYANVDQMDTLMLRGRYPGLVDGHSMDIFFPHGFDLGGLMPNRLDHLTALPFVTLLPFPLADNLWWFTLLLCTGLVGHRLGHQVGGSRGAAWLGSVALLTAEGLAREANLHHAPQAMVLFGGLYISGLLRLHKAPGWRLAGLTGLWLGLAASSYAYLGLFLLVGTGPVLCRCDLRRVGALAAVALAICLPWLVPLLGASPLRSMPPLPPLHGAELGFVAMHGNDLLFPLRRLPADTASALGLAFCAATLLGGRRQAPNLSRGFGLGALLCGLMVLGPVLLWRGQAVQVGGASLSLPFAWLGELHPFLARLTWPERWALVLPLLLLPLAAKAPRPGLFALLIGLEAFACSANLPLQQTDLRTRSCHAELATLQGAVLELPLARGGLSPGRVGVHQRFHGRPMVNPIALPPGQRPPAAWQTWIHESPWFSALHTLEEAASRPANTQPTVPKPEDLQALVDKGVGAIVLDVDPFGPLPPDGMAAYRAWMMAHAGEPIDLGCALVWWLEPDPAPQAHPSPASWRARQVAAQADPPQTLMRLPLPSGGPSVP
jgi:hypothetical protein